MNFSEENHQQLGALMAKVENIEADVAEMRSDVKESRNTLAEAKGYWKMLVIISGFSATVGALVATWFPWLTRH